MSDEKQESIRVLNIDAWRDDNGWQWNNWHQVKTITREEFEKLSATNRRALKWFRDAGLLSSDSAGRVAIDDDNYNLTVIDKSTREPLFAIEYGCIY
jgi:hypothetical protein